MRFLTKKVAARMIVCTSLTIMAMGSVGALFILLEMMFEAHPHLLVACGLGWVLGIIAMNVGMDIDE